MSQRITTHSFISRFNDFRFHSASSNANSNPLEFPFILDVADILDALSYASNASNASKKVKFSPDSEAGNFLNSLRNFISQFFKQHGQSDNKHPSQPNHNGSASKTSNTQSSNTQSLNGSYARNLHEAAGKTHVQLKPVIRGDEAKLDATVHDQASFGRLADKVAKEYGLDPNAFRAQLEAESAAFSNGYKQAMGHRGDVDRGTNASLGLGQISGNFLNGGPWANALTNTPELGKQNVSMNQYMNSVTTQLRMAAASDALRIHRVGSLDGALREYVSGHSNADPQNQIYIDNINRYMQHKEWMNIGR